VLFSENKNKRKTTSPLDNGKVFNKRRGTNITYAEMCGSRTKGIYARVSESCESGEEWKIQTSRRENSKGNKKMGVTERVTNRRLLKKAEGQRRLEPAEHRRPSLLRLE
jgi:hypothetical protein